MAKLIKELSVFFPTFNEEGNIKAVVDKATKVLDQAAETWEIIIVDDGSVDKTPSIIAEMAKKNKSIRVISHKKNKGYGAALKTGFKNAKYEWVAFSDSDGQFDFNDIRNLIGKKDEADLILGFRKKRADSFARKIFTFGWSTLARVILGLKAKDYSCGFKMIKKEVYKKIQPLVGEEKVTQIEMLVKARKKNFKFIEIGVNHYPRIYGKQTGANIKVVLKSLFDMFRLWGEMHDVTKKEVLILGGILVLGAFLRLFRIGEYMTFLGDEGRDAIIVRNLLVHADPILIGPGTSIGGMYLGPLYYYLIAIPLLLFNFSPIGPSVFVAVIGIATIALVWWVGREWFSERAGFIAALLYAISPTVISYSRSSWNPNVMPFFALLSIYSVWRVYKSKESSYEITRWLLILAVSFAFVLQSHYLGLLLAPTIVLFWYLSRRPIRNSLIAIGLFALLMSPLLIFDLRHDFMNYKALHKFLTVRQETVSIRPWTSLSKIPSIFTDINSSLLTAKNITFAKWMSLFMVGLLIYFRKRLSSNLWVLLSWLGFGLIGLGLYKQHIYDHYYGFLFPAIFLLTGFLISKLNKSLAVIFALFLVVINLQKNPLLFHPNKQLQRAINVSNLIIEKSMAKPFNLAVLAERNYEDGYRYFLEKENAVVMHADRWDQKTIVDQLFVVCEMEESKCDPTHSPKAEVANFGMSKVSEQWTVDGVQIYKLIHSQ